MSDEAEDWERLVLRGKTAAAGAVRKLATDVISWLEEWQEPKRSSYRSNLLTEEEYGAMLEGQGGVCAICKEKPRSGRLAVDHIHGTETVRGLLCNRCNTALGLFKDDPDRLAVAIVYLKHRKAVPPLEQTKEQDEGVTVRLGDAYLRGKSQKPG